MHLRGAFVTIFFLNNNLFCRYARVFAAAVWEKLFAKDPLSRDAGETYRAQVLSKGGAEDPRAILHDVLEGPVTLQPLLRELGIADDDSNDTSD